MNYESNRLFYFPFQACQTSLLSVRYKITRFVLCRCSDKASPKNSVPLVQQSENVIVADSKGVLRNNSRLETVTDWSSNVTTPPINNNNTNGTTADANVEALLNAKQDHQIRAGARIRDSLPGIINRYG